MANMTLKNNNKITITGVNSINGSVSTSVSNSGLATEVNTFHISGRTPHNKFFKIADVKVEVLEENNDYQIPSAPSLSISDLFGSPGEDFRNSLKLKVKEIKKDIHGAVRYYSYDLLYKSPRNTNRSDNIRFTLNQKTEKKKFTIDNPEIKRMIVGKSIMNSNGGVRTITTYGDPGAMFYIMVNKLREIYDANDTTHLLHTSHSNILKQGGMVVNTADNGKEYTIVKKTMGSSGQYSFRQTFPKHSKFSDEIATNPVNYQIVAGNWDSENDIYYVNDFESDTNTIVKNISQYKNPTITFRITMSTDGGGHTQTITYASSVGATAINDGNPYDHYKYEGRPNQLAVRYEKSKTITNRFRFCFYVLTNGVFSFQTGVTKPVFSTSSFSAPSPPNPGVQKASPHIDDGGTSFWTNTDPILNGGTEVRIGNITNSITSANTFYNFCADVWINKWGTKDVIMELDLDDVLAIA